MPQTPRVQPPDDGDTIQASTGAYERILEAVEKHEKAKKRMR